MSGMPLRWGPLSCQNKTVMVKHNFEVGLEPSLPSFGAQVSKEASAVPNKMPLGSGLGRACRRQIQWAARNESKIGLI